MIRPPFIIDPFGNYSRDNPAKQGYEVTIMNNIARKMNFSIHHIANLYDDWGYRDQNDTYNLMYGVLYRREVHMMYSCIYINYSVNIDFDFSRSYIYTGGYWWVPAAIEIPKWKNLIMIFQPSLMLTIFVSFLICSASWWFFDNSSKDLALKCLNSWAMMLLVSVSFPNSPVLKFQFLIWSLASLILSTLFFSQLLTILNYPIFEHQIQTTDEMLKSGLKYGFHPGYEPGFNDTIPKDKFILSTYEPCTSGLDCANRTAFQRDFALIKIAIPMEYFIPRFWTRADGRKMLYPVKEYENKQVHGIYTVKGFPLLDGMNKIILGLMENGLINKWEEDMKFVVRKETSDDDRKPLSLNHLQTPFYILLFGFILASITFIIELCTSKIQFRKNSRNLDFSVIEY